MEEALNFSISFEDFGIRTAIDLVTMLIIIGLVYFPKHRNKDFIFTFTLFNSINFMICYLLAATQIKMGFAFGLFAIFSIIRYRTIVISVKDMGYFFVCVAIGMLNSLGPAAHHYLLLIVCNLVIVLLTFLLENLNFINNESFKEIIYDKVELVKPEHREEMIKDLINRTGLNIHKIDIISLNYLKDTALIKVYYYTKESENSLPTSMDND